MKRVRLGAVEYLNARPLVYGLDDSPRFSVRFDLPSTCAALLHEGAIEAGLVPSIEYLRGGPYWIVPGLAIVSRGPVASVALFTTRPMSDVRSIALDTSSRTSVALTRILCARRFGIDPRLEPHEPDLAAMLARCDAALLIGDRALTQSTVVSRQSTVGQSSVDSCQSTVEKVDLGEVWTDMTGLPFVYAFWTGHPDALTPDDVAALTQARDGGVAHSEAIGRDYFKDAPEWQEAGARYLRDNIKYHLGGEERAGLELFYRYAAELGVVPARDELRFYR
jgi:chorismate dehydratase